MGSVSPFVRLGPAVPAEPGGAPWFCSCSACCFLAARGPVLEGVQSIIVASVSASPRVVRRPGRVTSVAGQTHLCAVKRSRQLFLRVGRGVGGSQRSSRLLRRGGLCWEQTRPASWPPLRAVCPARRFVCVAVSCVSQSWGGGVWSSQLCRARGSFLPSASGQGQHGLNAGTSASGSGDLSLHSDREGQAMPEAASRLPALPPQFQSSPRTETGSRDPASHPMGCDGSTLSFPYYCFGTNPVFSSCRRHPDAHRAGLPGRGDHAAGPGGGAERRRVPGVPLAPQARAGADGLQRCAAERGALPRSLCRYGAKS